MRLHITTDWRDWKRWASSHTSLGGMVLYSAGAALAALGGAAPWFHRIPLWLFSLIAAAISGLTFAGQFIILERRRNRGK